MAAVEKAQQFVVVGKIDSSGNSRPVWKGSAETFSRRPRKVAMEQGVVYALLEKPDQDPKVVILNVGQRKRRLHNFNP